jgi:ubiquinone/menaquinone biosynthesis C-methylase UbiE
MILWKRCPARFAFVLEHPLRRLMLKPERLVESLRLEPGSRVLDLGAGVGVVSSAVATTLSRGEIILVDPQFEMLARARRRVVSRENVAARFLCAVAERVPLRDASVDAVLMVTVLGEVDDAEQAFTEVRRVLRPGGLLSITEHLPDPDFRSASVVRALASRSGFAEREMTGGRWSYTINFIKQDVA